MFSYKFYVYYIAEDVQVEEDVLVEKDIVVEEDVVMEVDVPVKEMEDLKKESHFCW